VQTLEWNGPGLTLNASCEGTCKKTGGIRLSNESKALRPVETLWEQCIRVTGDVLLTLW